MTKAQFMALPRVDQLRWVDRQFSEERPLPAGVRVVAAMRPHWTVGARGPSEWWTARAVRGDAVLAVGHGPTRVAAVKDLRGRI